MGPPDLAHFTGVINSYLPEPQATLLNGIVFGTSIKGNYDLYQIVKQTGLLHIVVLSGMNITILAVFVLKITSGLSKRISLVLLSILIIIFVAIVHPQAPIIRAVLMCFITIGSFLFQRSIKPIVALFISAITIAIIWPAWITSLSFLLSFFSTLGIVLFVQNKNASGSFEDVKAITQIAIVDLKTSLAAQVMTVPLIMIYFKQLSLIAPISTLLVAPFIGPLMILAFLSVLLGSINWYLGLIPGLICYGITTGIFLIIKLLSNIPFIFIQF